MYTMKMNDENTFLKKRLKQLYADNDMLSSKLLLQEQISAEFKMREHKIQRTFEEQIADLDEKLERKEHLMQTKELKWSQIEEIMDEYIQEDAELRDKFRELRLNVKPMIKISNVVAENEQMKIESTRLQNEIRKLRDFLTIPDQKYDKTQDRLLLHNLRQETTDTNVKIQLNPSYVGANQLSIETLSVEQSKKLYATENVSSLGLPLY